MLERARTEAGNLAHQLKTPLAIIANAAGMLPVSDQRSTFIEQTKLMGRRIDYALTRARAAASGRVLGATTAIGPQLERMASAMRTLYASRGIEIHSAERSSSVVQVEPQDFDEAIGNLLDNACKWARMRVNLSAEDDAGFTRIVVEDDGPGLPEAERQSVFERGHRLDEAMPGTGLGLSIVQDIIAAYGGSVRLETSELGGLRTVLSLPLAATAARIVPTP